MDTRQVAEEYRLAHWAGIAQERKESGLGVRAFCSSTGITESSYYYWQRKMRKAACEGLAIVPDKIMDTASSVLTKVDLRTDSTFPSSVGIHHDTVCFEASGLRLTAGSRYPVDKLAELLQVVSRL